MRNYILQLILILSWSIGHAQSSDPNTVKETRDSYQQKSKSARSTGFVTLGVGLALIGTSMVTEESSPSFSTATLFVGTISTIASIPFFIKAGKYKRKANMAIKAVRIPSFNAKREKIPVVSFSISI